MSPKKYAGWVVAEEDLWRLSDALDVSPHYSFLPAGALRSVRLADHMERKAGAFVEWEKP